MIKKKLIEICEKYILDDTIAIIPEPYIPYIPNDWNKILILAESQNLSKTNQNYVDTLKSKSSNEKILRLYDSKNNVGVYPWDDGSLKLAIESSLNVEESKTSISNAVLWSQRNQTGANKNPKGKIKDLSTEIWDEFLKILEPKVVITTGKVAKEVINKTNWKGKKIALRLPSKNAMSRISGMFNEKDLLERFPEVKNVVDMHNDWVKSYSLNKIFYACHAVSLLKDKKLL